MAPFFKTFSQILIFLVLGFFYALEGFVLCFGCRFPNLLSAFL
jgi:hypothetical protein